MTGLNWQQQLAVAYGWGPLLILAGAGVGKTTTLANRLAAWLSAGIPPHRIVLLTFTRAAARELLQRAEAVLAATCAGMVATEVTRHIWGGTFHGFAHRLLRIYGQWIGLAPQFTVLDCGDAEDLLSLVQTDLGLSASERAFPKAGTSLAIYSSCVNCREPLEQVLATRWPNFFDYAEDLRELFDAYVERKHQQVLIDFDDLLLLLHALLSDGQAGPVIRGLFDCVLVDEYQDTNRLQAEIIKLLRPDGAGVTVVGDDAQAIYSFRGATVRNILDFPQQFPGTEIVRLEQNYRSTPEILQFANLIITQQTEGFAKQLWSDRANGPWPQLIAAAHEFAEAEFVSAMVLSLRESGLDFSRQAVLFRASHHSIPLEAELVRRRIPFEKRGGISFLQAAHVKDVLGFLRLGENPRDLLAGTRVLKLLPGIGPAKSQELMSRLIAANYDFRCWTNHVVPTTAQQYWHGLISLMCHLATGIPADLSAQVGQILAYYEPLMRANLDRPNERLQDLRQVELLASQYQSRATFLSDLAIDPLRSTQEFAKHSDADEQRLVLSTIHSAKGLEWDAVFVIHASDGNIPCSKSMRTWQEIDEELRLFFVALTRAKTYLHISYPFRSGSPRGPSGAARLTRFLPEALWPFCERMSFGHPPLLAGCPLVQPNAEVSRQTQSLRRYWESSRSPATGAYR